MLGPLRIMTKIEKVAVKKPIVQILERNEIFKKTFIHIKAIDVT